jgi:hypothetical protein
LRADDEGLPIELGAMEWGHEKNDKQPTRAREIQRVLSSSVHCVRATLGVVSLSTLDHRLERLDRKPARSARAFVFARRLNIIR